MDPDANKFQTGGEAPHFQASNWYVTDRTSLAKLLEKQRNLLLSSAGGMRDAATYIPGLVLPRVQDGRCGRVHGPSFEQLVVRDLRGHTAATRESEQYRRV